MTTIRFDVNDLGLRERFFDQLLFAALAALRDDTAPAWGMMSAQHMVEHLLWAFEISTGQAQTECAFPEAQCERLRAFLYDGRATPREFQNPLLASGLPPLRHAGAADAAAALRVAVDRFVRQAETRPATIRTHPIFGPIGVEEWARAHFKHCCHHLLQFGLISEDSADA
ncbi:MAG: DUF1569 domain-containing protein [Zetaproteobacteria bacterium]|nr:MAG: DUF1569 domain-containing protein [Zetaproteobacteria bacterium]